MSVVFLKSFMMPWRRAIILALMLCFADDDMDSDATASLWDPTPSFCGSMYAIDPAPMLCARDIAGAVLVIGGGC